MLENRQPLRSICLPLLDSISKCLDTALTKIKLRSSYLIVYVICVVVVLIIELQPSRRGRFGASTLLSNSVNPIWRDEKFVWSTFGSTYSGT